MATEPSSLSKRRRLQFGMRTLLIVMTAVAVMIGLVSWLGLLGLAIDFVALLVVYAWWENARNPLAKRASTAINVFGLGLVLLFFVVLLLPILPPVVRLGGGRMQCSNYMKQVALALHNYHAAYGTFPPAYIADEQGRPMHSWRVLILPYLGSTTFGVQYDFDEPWDGPNNRKYTAQWANLYACPSQETASGQSSDMTNYVAVVGPGTMWPGEDGVSLGDVADGTSQTILLVEVRDSGFHWAEPRDLHVSQMAPGVNPKLGQGISGHHPGGAYVVFADGHVIFLDETIDPKLLQDLLTRAGGEKIPTEFE